MWFKTELDSCQNKVKRAYLLGLSLHLAFHKSRVPEARVDFCREEVLQGEFMKEGEGKKITCEAPDASARKKCVQ